MSECYDHPQREAVSACSTCGKPLCADCVELEEEDRVFCYDCAVDRQLFAFKKKDRRVETGGEAPVGPKARARPSKPFLVLASILVVLIIASVGLVLYGKFAGGGGAAEVTPEQQETWSRDECMIAMEKVRAALNDYAEAKDEYPSSLAGLAEEGLGTVCPLSGAPYVFSITGGGFVLSCPNPEEHGVTALKASNAEIPHYENGASARGE